MTRWRREYENEARRRELAQADADRKSGTIAGYEKALENLADRLHVRENYEYDEVYWETSGGLPGFYSYREQKEKKTGRKLFNAQLFVDDLKLVGTASAAETRLTPVEDKPKKEKKEKA